MEKINKTIPILRVVPMSLMVLTVADATPKNLRFTEPIIAVVLGEANIPDPRPIMVKPRRI
jgi:hypothetical protein